MLTQLFDILFVVTLILLYCCALLVVYIIESMLQDTSTKINKQTFIRTGFSRQREHTLP